MKQRSGRLVVRRNARGRRSRRLLAIFTEARRQLLMILMTIGGSRGTEAMAVSRPRRRASAGIHAAFRSARAGVAAMLASRFSAVSSRRSKS